MAQPSNWPHGAQVLSPHNWGQPRAPAALRKHASVETASTFVPLLDWSEDRQPREELYSAKSVAASPQGVKPRNPATSAIATDGVTAESSDASISSSDDEFASGNQARKRVKKAHRRPAETSRQAANPQAVPQTAATAALPAVFKPGQAPSAGKAPHRAAEQSQPAGSQAGIDAYAEQLRSQQLKLKQAAVKAENELDRLKSLLQREQALQASVAKGSIRLADNGARLAGRLAQLHEDITRQEELVQMFAEQLAAEPVPTRHDPSSTVAAPAIDSPQQKSSPTTRDGSNGAVLASNSPQQKAAVPTRRGGTSTGLTPPKAAAQQKAAPANRDQSGIGSMPANAPPQQNPSARAKPKGKSSTAAVPTNAPAQQKPNNRAKHSGSFGTATTQAGQNSRAMGQNRRDGPGSVPRSDGAVKGTPGSTQQQQPLRRRTLDAAQGRQNAEAARDADLQQDRPLHLRQLRRGSMSNTRNGDGPARANNGKSSDRTAIISRPDSSDIRSDRVSLRGDRRRSPSSMHSAGMDRDPASKKSHPPSIQDNRPTKRAKRHQGISSALQSQRQAWMSQLTADATNEAARQEAEAKAAEYQQSWTFVDEQGCSQGPFHLADLKSMLAKGSVKGSTMVHDEEAEVSIGLATLVANSQRNKSGLGVIDKADTPAEGKAVAATEDKAQAGAEKASEERSASPPSFDSMDTPMDTDDAQDQSPPVGAAESKPVEPIWSPQYSPTQLAGLMPDTASVSHAPVRLPAPAAINSRSEQHHPAPSHESHGPWHESRQPLGHGQVDGNQSRFSAMHNQQQPLGHSRVGGDHSSVSEMHSQQSEMQSSFEARLQPPLPPLPPLPAELAQHGQHAQHEQPVTPAHSHLPPLPAERAQHGQHAQHGQPAAQAPSHLSQIYAAAGSQGPSAPVMLQQSQVHARMAPTGAHGRADDSKFAHFPPSSEVLISQLGQHPPRLLHPDERFHQQADMQQQGHEFDPHANRPEGPFGFGHRFVEAPQPISMRFDQLQALAQAAETPRTGANAFQGGNVFHQRHVPQDQREAMPAQGNEKLQHPSVSVPLLASHQANRALPHDQSLGQKSRPQLFRASEFAAATAVSEALHHVEQYAPQHSAQQALHSSQRGDQWPRPLSAEHAPQMSHHAHSTQHAQHVPHMRQHMHAQHAQHASGMAQQIQTNHAQHAPALREQAQAQHAPQVSHHAQQRAQHAPHVGTQGQAQHAPHTGQQIQTQHAQQPALHSQPATVLSPELAAALAAGVLGSSSLGTSQKAPPSTIPSAGHSQPQLHGLVPLMRPPSYPQQQSHEQQALDNGPRAAAQQHAGRPQQFLKEQFMLAQGSAPSAAAATALPPELSAALASGQLGAHLNAASAPPRNPPGPRGSRPNEPSSIAALHADHQQSSLPSHNLQRHPDAAWHDRVQLQAQHRLQSGHSMAQHSMSGSNQQQLHSSMLKPDRQGSGDPYSAQNPHWKIGEQHAEHAMARPAPITLPAPRIMDDHQHKQQLRHDVEHANDGQHAPARSRHELPHPQPGASQGMQRPSQSYVLNDPQHAPHRSQNNHYPQHASGEAPHGPLHSPHIPQHDPHYPQHASGGPRHNPPQAQHHPNSPQSGRHGPQYGFVGPQQDPPRPQHDGFKPHFDPHRPQHWPEASEHAQHHRHGLDADSRQIPSGHPQHEATSRSIPRSDGSQGWSPRYQDAAEPVRADWQGRDPYGPIHGEAEQPLTAEEAEWEWQRQLQQQDDSQEEDEWYDEPNWEHPHPHGDDYHQPIQEGWAAGDHAQSFCIQDNYQGPAAFQERDAPTQDHGWPPQRQAWAHDGQAERQAMGPDGHPEGQPWAHDGHPERSTKRQAMGPEGQVMAPNGQRRRHRRGGRRTHRRPPVHRPSSPRQHPGVPPRQQPGVRRGFAEGSGQQPSAQGHQSRPGRGAFRGHAERGHAERDHTDRGHAERGHAPALRDARRLQPPPNSSRDPHSSSSRPLRGVHRAQSVVSHGPRERSQSSSRQGRSFDRDASFSSHDMLREGRTSQPAERSSSNRREQHLRLDSLSGPAHKASRDHQGAGQASDLPHHKSEHRHRPPSQNASSRQQGDRQKPDSMQQQSGPADFSQGPPEVAYAQQSGYPS